MSLFYKMINSAGLGQISPLEDLRLDSLSNTSGIIFRVISEISHYFLLLGNLGFHRVFIKRRQEAKMTALNHFLAASMLFWAFKCIYMLK